MNLSEWDERYRGQSGEELVGPVRLLKAACTELPAGRALDLASGSGRNAIWLAEQGWSVTAVDGSGEALSILRARSREQGVTVETMQVDLTGKDRRLPAGPFDLVVMSYYLQRDLIGWVKTVLAPGGVLVAIVHVVREDEDVTEKRAALGELRGLVEGLRVEHYYEGESRDAEHRRPVAEVVAVRLD